MWTNRSSYTGISEGKRPLGRQVKKKDNIKMNAKEMGWDGVY
jgi:hypothetical protein